MIVNKSKNVVKDKSLLFDESIQLELNVAKLYETFYHAFPEDAHFWWKLVLEEKNHASLLQSGKDRFEPLGEFPIEMMSPSIQELKSVNSEIQDIIKKYQDTIPSREDAFNIALKLEQSAGELHFQQFMEKESESELDKIFQRLNRDDKDHAVKLRGYMNSHDINIK